MVMGSQCKACLLDKHLSRCPEQATPQQLSAFRTAVKTLIENSTRLSAPEAVEQIGQIYRSLFGIDKDYTLIKHHFNQLMLGYEPHLQALIDAAEDPFRLSVQYALAGNFIDFGAMKTVEDDKLREFLRAADQTSPDEEMLWQLRTQICSARKLVYLTDNCGEIVADKLLLRTISKLNPLLELTVIVRGQPAINDATMEDALQVGLDTVCHRILGNGCGVAGTVLHRLPPDAAAAVEQADVILSKGQGNYESLSGCGLNLFYLFLCKCQLFVDRFQVPLFSPIVTREPGHP